MLPLVIGVREDCARLRNAAKIRHFEITSRRGPCGLLDWSAPCSSVSTATSECPLLPPQSTPSSSCPLPPPCVHSQLLVSTPTSWCPLPAPQGPVLSREPQVLLGFGSPALHLGFLVRREGRGIGHFSSSCLCQVSHPVCVCCSCAQNLGMLFWHGCQTWILLSCADAVNFLETLGRG